MGIVQSIKKSGYGLKSQPDLLAVQAMEIFKRILHLIHTNVNFRFLISRDSKKRPWDNVKID
jgi:hypothetical protein